jgi:hypothetical protein
MEHVQAQVNGFDLAAFRATVAPLLAAEERACEVAEAARKERQAQGYFTMCWSYASSEGEKAAYYEARRVYDARRRELQTAVEVAEAAAQVASAAVAAVALVAVPWAQSYTGKQGCMCGCIGNYSQHKPAITAQRNRIARLIADGEYDSVDVYFHGTDVSVACDNNGRRYALYLKAD